MVVGYPRVFGDITNVPGSRMQWYQREHVGSPPLGEADRSQSAPQNMGPINIALNNHYVSHI